MRQNGSYIGYTPTTNILNAIGIWTLDEAYKNQQAGTWPKALSGLPVSGALLWLDASAANSVLDGSGNPISVDSTAVATWQDLSGNGYHATQSTVGSRPAWRNASNGQNGLPVISFNGSSSTLAGSPISTTTNYSLYMVYKYAATGGTSFPPIFYNGNSGSNGYGYGRYTSNRSVLHGGRGFAQDSAMPTTWESVQVIRSSGGFAFYVNGSTVSIGTLTGYSAPTSQYNIGSCTNGSTFDYANALVAEIAIFGTAHSSADVSTMASYLKAKWGTP